jgi:uncharacterized membrane protein
LEHCGDCHQDGAKKGGVQLNTLEELLAGSGDHPGIIPGDVEASRLIQSLRRTGDVEPMPPKKALDPEIVKDFEHWVAIGAPWPTGPAVSAPVVHAAPPAPIDPLGVAGRLHPLVVHFPIACLLLTVLTDLLALRWHRDAWRRTTLLLLVIGVAGAAMSVVSGLLLADGQKPADLDAHRLAGFCTLGLGLAALPLVYRSQTTLVRLALLGALAALVGLTGHLGGVMVHGADFPWR